jgi:hypothetical protein
LDSHNHGYLTIGVGKPYGFAQFTNNQDNRPYLITTNPAIEASTENVEFDSGGTITQVPIHYCLEIDTIIEIAVFFFKYGKIPENVYWQEV